MALAAFLAGCQPAASPVAAPAPAAKTDAHDHKPGTHGGALVSIGKNDYHMEAIVESGGTLRVFLFGADESKVIEIDAQTLNVLARLHSESEWLPFELKAVPQAGDAAGRTSQFVGTLPAAIAGKTAIVKIPNLMFGHDRYRVAFIINEKEAAMPAKLATEDERKLFLTAGGAYTAADIKANGEAIPTVKFKGIRAVHDDNPKPGQRICPISKTLANPKFVWVIGGKSYEFCCTPCIEEFVSLAKEKPGEIKDPKDYVK